MNRRDCDCGASWSQHTGTYCTECGELKSLARYCPSHPGEQTRSSDGRLDAPCGLCEQGALEEACEGSWAVEKARIKPVVDDIEEDLPF